MAKFSGKVGYVEMVEIAPGVWEEVVTERPYLGDVIRNSRKLQTSDSVNDDVVISSDISIVADPYAVNHIFAMRYVEYLGVKWKVDMASPEPPRIRLTLGGMYNNVNSIRATE